MAVRRGRARTASVAAAVALALAAALTAVGAPAGGALASFVALAAVAGCFAVAYVAGVRPASRRLASLEPPVLRAAAEAATLVAAAAAAGLVAVWLVRGLGAPVHPLRLGAAGLGVMVAIRLVEAGYDALRRRVREVELAEERARREALLAELKALRARTDPHFLFNALNTVAGLIVEDPARAEAAALRLAAFFRHQHAAAGADRVPLGEELDAAAAYLAIQALRFGDRLRWRLEADEGVRPLPVPPFVLQPLVENAVVHGLDGGSAVTVLVRAVRRGDRLEVAVEDDGPGPGGSRRRGTGTALADLRRRLELVHGDGAALVTGARAGGGFRAVVTLPAAAGRGP